MIRNTSTNISTIPLQNLWITAGNNQVKPTVTFALKIHKFVYSEIRFVGFVSM